MELANSQDTEYPDHNWNCVSLYKIAKLENLVLPPPNVHVYLAGTIERFDDSNNEVTSKYVITSINELNQFIGQHQHSEFNTIIYFTGRISGDFSMNSNALLTSGRDSQFSSECYNVAKIYGTKIGRKEEPKIFDSLVENMEKYLELISTYRKHIFNQPNFELTDDDFRDFREYIKEISSQTIEVLFNPIRLIKSKSDKKLLI